MWYKTKTGLVTMRTKWDGVKQVVDHLEALHLGPIEITQAEENEWVVWVELPENGADFSINEHLKALVDR